MESHITPGTKSITGKAVSTQQFRFHCGFEIPLKQAEWVVGQPLSYDDTVTFHITTTTLNKHTHRCTCGKEMC
jgi:hypothetical protein